MRYKITRIDFIILQNKRVMLVISGIKIGHLQGLKLERYVLKTFDCPISVLIGTYILIIFSAFYNRYVISIQYVNISHFRCYINHRIPVAYTAKALNNGLKPSRPTLNDNSSFVHGMWSQSFDVRACPGSILITKSPKAFEHGLVGGSILLECEAEIAPDITFFKGKTDTAELQYRW